MYAALKVSEPRFWVSEKVFTDLYVAGRQERVLQELEEPIKNQTFVEPWWLNGIPVEVPEYILKPVKLPPQPLPRP